VAQRLYFGAALIALIVAPDATGAAATWTNIGPDGAVVLAIAADPITDFVVYAGVQGGGVFRSDPSSATFWHAANTGLGNLNVRALAASPAGGGVVLGGTGSGIYRTVNGGDSWAMASGPPSLAIDEIAFDRTNPANVYAVSFEGWIGKSSDGGVTWQALGGPASSQRPQAVHVDPTNGAIVYVGTIDGGLYKSTNEGSTWTAQNEGLTNLHVSAIAVDPTAPSIVYLGTDNGGAFRSTDGGATWAASLRGTDVEDIVVTPAGRAFLVNQNGLFGSVNGGLGWEGLAVVDRGNALSFGPGNPGTLWIGFGQVPQSIGGVVFSTSPGSGQLEGAFDGLNGLTISDVASDPANSSNVLGCGPTGTYLSPDAGATWLQTSLGLCLSLAYDAETPGVLYQGYAGGIAKSTDGGGWEPASTGLPVNPVVPLVVRTLLVLPGSGGRLLAGTAQGVYRTSDGGASWSAPGTPAPTVVYSLARDPASAAVWAGALDGVYRSTDDGVTWALAGGATASPVFSVLDSAVVPTKIFAGTGTGLLVSTNEGSTWTPVGGGLPAAEVFALAEDSAVSAIFAGGAAGVFESLDGGATWHPAADGLTNPFVLSLEVLPNGTLLAGTRAGSIFRRSDTSTVPRDPVERSEGHGETREVPPRPED
jgi:photosystem II stability/assembly factor-like uncharacterized protein